MVLLYKIYCLGNDRLPSFIDREKEARILEKLILIDHNQPSKHQHYKPINLTRSGQIICDKLRSEGFFLKCGDLKLDDRVSFDQSFRTLFLTSEEYQRNYDDDEILTDLGLPIVGEDRIQAKVSLTILGWKKLNIENEDSYEFKLKIVCKRCNNPFEFTQKIQYFEYDYDPRNFSHICPNCNLTFFCDSYFSLFSMYDE